MGPALRVEVEQIERVVFDLLTIDIGERCRTNLEFQHKDGVARQQHCIDTPAEPQQRILEQQMPIRREPCQCTMKELDLRTRGSVLRD
jgi:hypothetical protein